MSSGVHLHSARHSISPAEIPFSPFAAPPPSPATRSLLSPGSATLSRRTTRTLSSPLSDPHSILCPERVPVPVPVPAADDLSDETYQLQQAWAWFDESAPQGRLGPVRRNHALDPLSGPYWMGYSSESLDWDSLLTFVQMDHQEGRGTRAFERDGAPPIPRRVLDVGCGTAPHWCLKMVSTPGWESTQFVGLELAPVVLPTSMLSFERASRLSFVQHNFLEGLPFDDARFNLVRIANLSLGIPEHKWQDLIEEAVRVLAPGGLIEIAECDFLLVLPPAHLNASQTLQAEAARTLQDAVEAVYHRRFINNATLSPIRPALAINCSDTTTSALTLSFPASSPTYPAPRAEDEARVLLHAYAQRVAAVADTLAADLASVRIAARPPPPLDSAFNPIRAPSTPDTPDAAARVRPKPRHQLEREIRDTVEEWSEDLVDRAAVARLVEERWGWVSEFDREIEEVLEVYVPVFAKRLREYEREERRDDGAIGGFKRGEVDPEIDFRKNQITFAKREGEIELRAVKKRLGRLREGKGEQGAVIGTLTLHNWVTRAI